MAGWRLQMLNCEDSTSPAHRSAEPRSCGGVSGDGASPLCARGGGRSEGVSTTPE